MRPSLHDRAEVGLACVSDQHQSFLLVGRGFAQIFGSADRLLLAGSIDRHMCQYASFCTTAHQRS